MDIELSELVKSLNTSFVSRSVSSNSFYAPTLLYNDWKQGKKILSSISTELETCTEFLFSVAFITSSGLACLLQILDSLQKQNIRGKIITTNYLNFTDPHALRKLLEFSNIEVRAYTKGGFHPKGYIFKQTNYYSMIIGSANLTQDALNKNQEWSVRFLSCTDGQIVYTVKEEFERIWQQSDVICKSWLDSYEEIYRGKRYQWINVSQETGKELGIENSVEEYHEDDEIEIIPNEMQEKAIQALKELRKKNKNKALLIAATGTGKTYLSVFDVKQTKPKRVLYIAHRDLILSKSETSFRKLLSTTDTGFLTGTEKNYSAKYLFASVFTLTKDNILNQFSDREFDYIIIDEVHHAGANSYKKVMSYFKPQFWLGLTATPERTDQIDIFEMFDYNIAYEIRLQKALEADLLCPFHYYGVTDLTVNGEIITDKSEFSKLICEERILHIKNTLIRYKNNSFPVKGLIFCSRKEEAITLSNQLNQIGFYTKYLLGNHTDQEREKVIEELEDDNNPLQYIISVDIFNEGIDIPAVNQIVMLRPTQSAVIFVQQLGRGLRKSKNKPYVSVIDFIGNYENNFFIPIALYGNTSYDKDTLRKYVASGSAMLPGSSTIQISEIARQKIYDSISRANFSKLKLLKEEYLKLKRRINCVPSMVDFINNEAIDPYLFIEYAGSYYHFKKKIHEERDVLSKEEQSSLLFIAKEFGKGIRIHELKLIQLLTKNQEITISEFKQEIENCHYFYDEADLHGAIRTLSEKFYGEEDKRKYGAFEYVEIRKNKMRRGRKFEMYMQNKIYAKELEDCINYGLAKLQEYRTDRVCKNNFILYRKYTRKDVCKLLNWEKDCSSTIYGYKTDYQTNVCPIFVTYKKSESIAESIDYDDHFLDETRFNWMSKNKRTASSKDVYPLINQHDSKIRIMLFVKKDDKETSFFYLGDMNYAKYEETTQKTKNKDLPIVNIQFDMQYPVRQDIYKYLETKFD